MRGKRHAEHARSGLDLLPISCVRLAQAPSQKVASGAEQNAADGLAEEHALRTEPPGAEPDQRHGADGYPAPIGQRRPERPAEIVERRIGDEMGAQEDEQNRYVGREETDQIGGPLARIEDGGDLVLRQIENGRGGEHDGGAEEHGVDQRAPNALGVAGPEVLADHRTDGAGEREDHPEGNRNDPADDRKAGNRIVAERRHAADHIGIAEGRGEIGQDGGAGDLGNPGDIARQSAGLETADDLFPSDDAIGADRENRDPGGDRGQRCPLDAEIETEDQDRVERRIDQATDQGRGHSESGGADSAQGAAQAHGERQDRHRGDDDAEIGDGQLQRPPLGAEHDKEGGQADPDDRGEGDGERERDHAHMDHIALGALLLAGPDRARHQGGHGDRQADADRGGEEQDGAGIADRGGEFHFAQQAEEIQIKQIDHEDCDQPRGRRRRHHRDVAKDWPFREDGGGQRRTHRSTKRPQLLRPEDSVQRLSDDVFLLDIMALLQILVRARRSSGSDPFALRESSNHRCLAVDGMSSISAVIS